jgi:hypothetical protein
MSLTTHAASWPLFFVGQKKASLAYMPTSLPTFDGLPFG